MSRTILILLAVLALFVYVGFRIAAGIGLWPAVVFLSLLFAGVAAYRTIHGLKTAWLRRLLLTVVHLEMAFISFLLALIIARDVIFLPLSIWRPDVSATAFGVSGTLSIFVISAIALALGITIARSGPRIVRVKVPLANLPTEFEGFTIAQISDLHVGPATSVAFVERVVARALKLSPMMVALTGDIGDGDLQESLETLKPLTELSKVAHGSFYVPGNHEYYWNGLAWIGAFKNLGFKTLLNSHEVIRVQEREMLIAGVLDPAAAIAKSGDGPDAAKALAGAPRMSYPKILLAHQPGIAQNASDLGFDLQLSGHTHAGQFFPWTLVIKHVHEFSNGLGRKARMWVYVNPGTGSWGPPVRLGTLTEITLLTLVRES